MNYFPFHIGDYLSATRHLSWEEDLAYRRVLDTYYTNEKPLPSEVKQVCRLILATTEQQREAVKTILEEFFELTPDGWINRRADAEILAMQGKQQKQRDRANAMWEKRRSATGISAAPDLNNAPAMPRHDKSGATALNNDANALPPTPTPTPTPTPVLKNTFSPDLLPESKPDVPTGFLIPLNDGTEYPISERDLTEWEKAYLAVNVKQELREIRTWSLANKTKRKTKNGVLRFIVAWLAKAQDTPSHSRNFSNGGGASGAAWEGAQ